MEVRGTGNFFFSKKKSKNIKTPYGVCTRINIRNESSANFSEDI